MEVRRRADRWERDEREQLAKFREEMAEAELRRRTRLATDEAAAKEERLKVREEVVELEVQKRVQSDREEQLRVRAEIRERSRDSETGLAYTLMLERVQQQMADIQRQA